MNKLCIDPGHGMSNRRPGVYDPGAVFTTYDGKKRVESIIALEFALTGKFVLKKNLGADIYLTRDDDTDPTPVASRDDRAMMNECDLFISIHVDSWEGNGNGFSVYYRDARDKALAQIVHDAYRRATGMYSRGVRDESNTHVGRLAVLDFKGPACLLELGRIESTSDYTAMTDTQNKIDFWNEIYREVINANF